jgi:diguanylate cyclase (GGDEF)-like protein/PAS domain S-box-containing protein
MTSQANQRRGTILIVDDLPDNLRVLSATLGEHGYKVRCAKTAALALMAARNSPPDLILLDINMPEMNGYELCQKLKADEITRNIPTIFLSALDDILDKVKAFNVGGVDYITKPFQIEEVLVRVENQLALQAAKAEIHALNTQLEEKVQQRTIELKKEIAERLIAAQLLEESERRLEGILTSLEDVVWSISLIDRRILYLNKAVEKVYGCKVQDFLNNSSLRFEMVHPDERIKVKQAFQSLSREADLDIEYRIVRTGGEIRWVRDRAHLVRDEFGRASHIDGITSDITAQKEAEEKLIHDALYDTLTGLPNRNLFMERVKMAIDQSKRHAQRLFAVLFIDLDRFKLINDSLGHLSGDRLLVGIARRLEECLRHTDTVARLGGDEFTILLAEVERANDVTMVAERLIEKLSVPFEIEGHQIFTSASIGIVFGSTEYQAGAEMLRDADIAMYRAKDLGKSCYAIFDQKMYERTLNLLQLENDLRSGIDRREFILYYQPIVTLTTGRLTGFEVLLRWQHPQRGIVSPVDFISVAEDTGLIVPLGELVLEEACRQFRAWQQQYPFAHTLKVSVNLASQQIQQTNLIPILDRILLETGLSGTSLKLEITEGTLLDRSDRILTTLKNIQKRGVELSIDDFGTGYSSLSYLHRFPIDTIKIDRSFIIGMTEDEENIEIVKTIITLAESLGMEAIAEGIETQAQVDALKQLGCQFGQGYFFAKPLDPQSAETLLKEAKTQHSEASYNMI